MHRIRIMAVALLMFAPVRGLAIDFGKRVSFGGGLGVAYPVANAAFKGAYDPGQIWSGDIKFGLHDTVTLIADYSNIQIENEITEADLEMQPVTLSFRIHPFHRWIFSPYIIAGAGVSMNKLTYADNTFVEWNKFTWRGGLGWELFLNQGASLGVEGFYHHMVATPDESPLRLMSWLGKINIYFGEESRTKIARREAEKARKEAEHMKRLAEISQMEAEQMKEEAQKLLEESKTAKAQAATYKQEATEADKARQEAERLAREQAAKTQLAQNELNKIREMIKSKTLAPVAFAYSSSRLQVDSFQALDMVAEVAGKYPDLALRVEGHTDSVGNDAYNLKLSQQRAESVRQYLVEAGGLDENRVKAVGFGESQPIAPNTSKAGRAKNRRVEFIFFIP